MVTHHVGNQLPAGSAGDRLTKLLDSIPFNEISRLEVNHKQLRLLRHLPAAEGFKICHISDLHFTGQLNIDHYQFVVDRVLEFEADLIAITGDIIDYARCLPWLEPVLGRLQARYGCLFLLGNHDRRLSDVDEPARILSQLGHVDTGKRDVLIHTPTMRISVSGNERPWLERHDCAGQSNLAGVSQDTTRAFPELRLGLSHSPDQLPWARGLALDLLLAGHTHGGQVRFPLIGPIVAPSRYGSRFASGVFARAPTLMHVSRGIAGTHPLRWRCLPEVSLLTLHS
ncbi:MAG: metallophosphoesterase [Planctomycetales bacterium]|nr:metallophosphoesterase [Planctomycetales bacterium]